METETHKRTVRLYLGCCKRIAEAQKHTWYNFPFWRCAVLNTTCEKGWVQVTAGPRRVMLRIMSIWVTFTRHWLQGAYSTFD